MSWKMLAAGRDAVVLQAADDGGAEPRNGPRILAECTIADDGIARIGVNVEYGGVIEADPDGFELGGERRREAARERLVAAASQRRHWRPFGERRTQTRDAATFLVHRNPQRQTGRQRLEIVTEFHDLFRRFDVAREEGHAAKLELASQRSH